MYGRRARRHLNFIAQESIDGIYTVQLYLALFFPPLSPMPSNSLTWNRWKTRIKPRVYGDSFYGHERRAATKEIRKLMHIQGEARGWTVSMVSIADRKTGTILHAAFPASLDPFLLTFASILCTRWFVGNHCQELDASPGPFCTSHCTCASVPEILIPVSCMNRLGHLYHKESYGWTRWNTKIWTRGELPIGLDTSSYRADSSGKGLKGFVGVLVTDDSRKQFFFFSFRLVSEWFNCWMDFFFWAVDVVWYGLWK